MNNYNYDDEIREERLAREIGRKFAELGFGTVQTEEEYEKSKKNFKKKEKRDMFFVSVFSGLRTIIYTPLSIAFHAVSFVAKGIGYISSFGLIAGLLSVSVFLCFQERCSVWRNRRIEQGSMLHHLSFCCLSGKLCLRKNPHLL